MVTKLYFLYPYIHFVDNGGVLMKILLSWLKEYIALEETPAQIAKMLTMAGLEVDAVRDLSAGCQGVVVCKILDVQQHPQADRLKLASVTDGEKVYHLVCGAPNCRPGIKTALAVVWATVLDYDGKPVKIKKSKIRGVESDGMLCAPAELGLVGDDGIIELADHIKEGTDVASLYNDVEFEISLTPNLGHCSSILGVARELSALTGIPIQLPQIEVTTNSNLKTEIKVTSPVDCPRYACRLLKGVTIGESPDWLKKRLEASGIRPINHVVDATNYVMLELGHPLHAFDSDKLTEKQLVVRNAKKGESLTTLDGKERILEERDLLICDGDKPVALAGVMGGANSEVGASTKNILLEAAYFSPGAIRRTSKRLGLMTDASKRFERGTDPNGLALALDRVTMLIQQVSPEVTCGEIQTTCGDFPKKIVKVRLNRINQLLGTHLGVGEVEDVFLLLGMHSTCDGSDCFSVEIPTYRNDVQEEVDLIEEVARIYGYDHIDQGSNSFSFSTIPHDTVFLQEREMRERLLREGLQEFLTCDLIGQAILDIVGESGIPEKMWVKVLNPNSSEQSILRTSLLPGLLQVVKHNQDHQNHHIAGFEIGRVHFKENETYREPSVVGIVLAGESHPANWNVKSVAWDFFGLKGIIENLLNEIGVTGFEFKESSLSMLHPGRQAAILVGSVTVGVMGEIHPVVLRRMGISQRVLFAEMNLADLFAARPADRLMRSIPIYPGSERDWTLTLKEEVPVSELFKEINAVKSPFLESSSLVGIYRSDQLGKGLKNVTVNFVYRDKEKTISQEVVDREHAHLMNQVERLKL